MRATHIIEIMQQPPTLYLHNTRQASSARSRHNVGWEILCLQLFKIRKELMSEICRYDNGIADWKFELWRPHTLTPTHNREGRKITEKMFIKIAFNFCLEIWWRHTDKYLRSAQFSDLNCYNAYTLSARIVLSIQWKIEKQVQCALSYVVCLGRLCVY